MPSLRLPSPSLLGCLAAVVVLAGCGDPYYQTRYIPLSAEAVYSPTERAGWHGDREVYELPAHPPAVDSTRPRLACLEPDQAFKSQTMLGLRESDRVHDIADPEKIYAMGEETAAGPKPLKDYRLYAWSDDQEPGAKEHIGIRPVGVMEEGPSPFYGELEHSDAPKVADWRDDESEWCNADR
jgi:hypothetical protein